MSDVIVVKTYVLIMHAQKPVLFLIIFIKENIILMQGHALNNYCLYRVSGK